MTRSNVNSFSVSEFAKSYLGSLTPVGQRDRASVTSKRSEIRIRDSPVTLMVDGNPRCLPAHYHI